MRQGIVAGVLAVSVSFVVAPSGSAAMMQAGSGSSEAHRFIVTGCIKARPGQGADVKNPDLMISDYRGGPVASFLLDGKDPKLVPWVNDTVQLTGTVPAQPGAGAPVNAPAQAAPAPEGGRGGRGGGRGAGGRGGAAAPVAGGPRVPISGAPLLMTVEQVAVIARGCNLKAPTE